MLFFTDYTFYLGGGSVGGGDGGQAVQDLHTIMIVRGLVNINGPHRVGLPALGGGGWGNLTWLELPPLA